MNRLVSFHSAPTYFFNFMELASGQGTMNCRIGPKIIFRSMSWINRFWSVDLCFLCWIIVSVQSSFLLVQFENSVLRFCFSVQHIRDLVVKYHSKYFDLFGPFQYLFHKQPGFYYLSEKQIDSNPGRFSHTVQLGGIDFLHFRLKFSHWTNILIIWKYGA